MTLTDRERRLLFLLVPSVVIALILRFTLFADPAPVVNSGAATGTGAGSVKMAQQRLTRLRQIAATLQAREAVAKQTGQDLTDREKGVLQAATAPQAQARLLEVARQIGKQEQIDVRGGDFGTPKVFGEYGLVYATISFECHVEQLVNFMAALSKQPELISPSEVRMATGNSKEKLMNVRMVLAGVVPKKLVPEKKGLGGF